jgi:hypothetical protein
MLTNSYFIAVVIPLILLFAGALGKKLVRGSPWIRQDFFLGVQATIASMSASLIYMFDIAKDISKQISGGGSISSQSIANIVSNGSFLALSFILS